MGPATYLFLCPTIAWQLSVFALVSQYGKWSHQFDHCETRSTLEITGSECFMRASRLFEFFFFKYEEMSRNEAPILTALCGDQKDQWSQVRSPNSQQLLAFLMNEGQNS